MKFYANAKINLGLDVLGKRDDGYHSVDMIMQEVSLFDILDIELTSDDGIELRLNNAKLPCDEKNIAYRAAQLFFEKTGLSCGCAIELTKNIPVCAGLGGGSTDAAAVLKGLNELCSFPLDTDTLLTLGLMLGADVPFCITGGTARAGGIGEILTPLVSKIGGYLALIKPDIDISTAKAYSVIDNSIISHPDISASVLALEEGDINTFIEKTGNVFECVSLDIHPEIELIKKHMYDSGALFSMMSGSGPTVFGVFDNEYRAKTAFESYNGSYGGGGVCTILL